ncbi:MAG: hypothetical protein OXQ31_03960 [Spirochaetaceae bacterium]|nr:hypothetical protein [Spirochaetaceae bacterium]
MGTPEEREEDQERDPVLHLVVARVHQQANVLDALVGREFRLEGVRSDTSTQEFGGLRGLQHLLATPRAAAQ